LDRACLEAEINSGEIGKPRKGKPLSAVSRDLVRAVLEVRDHRHNETHAALVAIYQALVAELLDAGLVKPGSLARRLDLVNADITEEAHGEAARDLVMHIADWLREVEDPPTPHPRSWSAPPINGPVGAA
jgi:hypothetical protein